jgi:diacylglycerol kinase
MAIWPDEWRLSKQPGYRAKSLRDTIIGCKHPFRGLWVAFLSEGSLRFEFYSLLIAVGLGAWRGWSGFHWATVLIGFTLILSFEFSNTAHEMSQRLANPRRTVKRHVLVAPPKPPPLKRWQRWFLSKLGLDALSAPAENIEDEYVLEDVPLDNEKVRNIYDVAAAQVLWPFGLTLIFLVWAMIWPHGGLG